MTVRKISGALERRGGMEYFSYLTENYALNIMGYSRILIDVLFPLSIAFLFHKFRKSGRNILFFFLRWAALYLLQINFNCIRTYFSLSSGNWNLLVFPALLLCLAVLGIRDYHPYVRIAWGSLMLTFFFYGQSFFSVFDYFGQGLYAMLESTALQAAVFLAGAVFLKCNCFEKYLTGAYVFLIGLELVIIVCLAVEIIQVEYYGDSGVPLSNAFLVSGLLAVELIVYFVFVKFMKRNAAYMQEKLALTEMSAQYKMAELSAKNYAELKMLRHDLKNQYSYISILLSEKQYDKAEAFFGELCGRAEAPFAEISTGNKVLDIVLNFKSRSAAEKGIRFSAGVAVPKELPVRDSDLAGILTNLLDNAIENSPEEGGEIRADIYFSGNVLTFEITNRLKEGADPERALKLKTTKADKGSHGWGSRIVRKTVEKYDGSMKYSVRDGNVFAAEGMLVLDTVAPKEGEN